MLMRDELATLLGDTVHLDLLRSVQTIEIAVWLIVFLLVFANIIAFLHFRNHKLLADRQSHDWQQKTELAYGQGDYKKALNILETAELVLPKSADVKFWQGRCYFQQEAWEQAAGKFEECLRLEPWYRKSVKDWMAFIELNELVPGVEGYLDTP